VSSPEAALRGCWQSLGGAAHPETIERVLTHHREAHRHYHTAVHVMWVLRHVDDLLPSAPAAVDAGAVRAAALFHDVIYDPLSSTNEADSARFAVDALDPLGWDPVRVARVAGLIEATAAHEVDVSDVDGADGGALDAAVLLDADLAILGSPPREYAQYVAAVRAEYGHVDADAWRSGRATVLRSFLERPLIYATPVMRRAREARARANLSTELAGLDTATPHSADAPGSVGAT
jgi:predicted metal-dependent HD superfamily phosphohydrolase